MLILPKSCFFHVPKTGGTWVTRAIQSTSIDCLNFRPEGNSHSGLKQCPCLEKFKFAFVRHPAGLYRSYWQFKMTYGWDANNRLDQDCRSNTFCDFVRQVLDQYPGIYSSELLKYVGEKEHEIEFIGKYENLVNDLVTALKLAGEVFDESALRAFQPVNVSDKIAYPAIYSGDLEEQVRKAERMVLERFNYE